MTPTTEFSRIFDVVERWVSNAPSRDALAFGDLSWTWAQLDERIRRAAGALRAYSLGPGDRLAVLDKNHPACLELTLAASIIGSANVVINFRLSREELVHLLDDSAAQVVVVGAEFAATLAGIRDRLPKVREVVVLGGDGDEYEQWLPAAAPADQLPKVGAADGAHGRSLADPAVLRVRDDGDVRRARHARPGRAP